MYFSGKITVRATIIAIFALFCNSCLSSSQLVKNNNNTSGSTSGSTSATEKSAPKLVYGDIIIKERSDYIIIPVLAANDPNSYRDSYRDSYFRASSYGKDKNYFHNLIFYNQKNGKLHLLLNKPAIISDFDFIEIKQKDKPIKVLMLIRIIENDTNGDKVLDNQDAVIGYLADLSGKNLQQITPNNTQLISWTVDKRNNTLFLRIVKDSDQDKKFTDRDHNNFLKVNLNQPDIGTEIISEKIEKDINSLILKPNLQN